MKKLMLVAGFIALSLTTSFAQWKSNHDRDNDRYDNRNTRNTYETRRGESWGYDNNWNMIKGGRGSVAINSFQRQSRDRIADGISRGLITSSEAKKLLVVAEQIERKENRYLRNGRLTKHEARELTEDLNALNHMISKDLRDRDRQSNDDRYGRRRF
jgi:hypothetical protein